MTPTNAAAIAAGRRTTVVSGATNLIMAGVKTSIGVMTGSAALVADGIHSAADFLTDIFAFVMLRLSREEADDSHPYGHGKFETFGTLSLAILLAITALAIGWEAVEKLLNAAFPALGPLALAVAAASIVANEALFHYTRWEGTRVKAPILVANAWHHRTDSLSSLAAVVGIGANMAGWPAGDAVAALAVVVLLLHMSWQLGAEAFHELVDAAVDPETRSRIEAIITATDGVQGCHNLRARALGGRIFVDVHVEVASDISVSEGHAIAEGVEHALKTGIEHVDDVVAHVDPDGVVSAPLPHDLSRSQLLPRLEQAVSATVPGAHLVRCLLHIHKQGNRAEVVVALPANASAAEAAPMLQAALAAPHTPLARVEVSFITI